MCATAHEMTKRVCKILRLNSKRLLRRPQKMLGATLFCRTLYSVTLFNCPLYQTATLFGPEKKHHSVVNVFGRLSKRRQRESTMTSVDSVLDVLLAVKTEETHAPPSERHGTTQQVSAQLNTTVLIAKMTFTALNIALQLPPTRSCYLIHTMAQNVRPLFDC